MNMRKILAELDSKDTQIFLGSLLASITLHGKRLYIYIQITTHKNTTFKYTLKTTELNELLKFLKKIGYMFSLICPGEAECLLDHDILF